MEIFPLDSLRNSGAGQLLRMLDKPEGIADRLCGVRGVLKNK
ncbi:hypothetical protein HNQ93_003784 [Hymenobacter luteus]|uniref:Uncharacterized protein n=2 Tax=Hymenobacter TaxID=89966 RepID=A0A7W9WD97_9BACT|nr:hypothetical protein [Hymenobacter latericoloratus]MBB6060908.1 hypothetical protein [Hymenobacter luteus]